MECSFIEQPDKTIAFFKEAEIAYREGKSVKYDLSDTKDITETAAAVLISHIKDRNINLGHPSKIQPPIDRTVQVKLRRLGIFKKVSESADDIDPDSIPVQKLTNLKVANQIARQLVLSSAVFVYGEERRISELYSTLIELMANTNNHADSHNRATYPWWLFSFPSEQNTIKFVFLDLGVGIFNSLPVKQFMIRNPYKPGSRADHAAPGNRKVELKSVFGNLARGRIKSSTGQSARGKGIPHVVDCAKSGHFSKFYIVSNDAYIDVLKDEVDIVNDNFSGTLYYFEFHGVDQE